MSVCVRVCVEAVTMDAFQVNKQWWRVCVCVSECAALSSVD